MQWAGDNTPKQTGNSSGYRQNIVHALLLVSYTSEGFYQLFLNANNVQLQALHYHFRPEDGLTKMVNIALELCLARDLMPELLAEVKRAKPIQYALFAPQLPSSRGGVLASWATCSIVLYLLIGGTVLFGVLVSQCTASLQEHAPPTRSVEEIIIEPAFPSAIPTLPWAVPQATATLEPPTIVVYTPTPALMSAKQAIRDYYSFIQQGQFQTAWKMSGEYSIGLGVKTLSEFEAGWRESGPAKLQPIFDIQETENRAVMKVVLYYPKKKVNRLISYTLTRDFEKGDPQFGFWIFSDGEFLDR